MKRALLTLLLAGLVSLFVTSCGGGEKETGTTGDPETEADNGAGESHEDGADGDAGESHEDGDSDEATEEGTEDNDGAAEIEAAPEVSDADMVAAQAKFDQICWVCHGKSGAGDGPSAAALDPKPRKYSDKEWQATVTNAELAKTILEGGPAVGLSSYMTPSPDLKDKPGVVNGLVAIVRSFAK